MANKLFSLSLSLSLSPLISYGCECIHYNSKKVGQLNVCWNNAYYTVTRVK